MDWRSAGTCGLVSGRLARGGVVRRRELRSVSLVVHVHAQLSHVCTYGGAVRVRVHMRLVTESVCLASWLSHASCVCTCRAAYADEMRQ
jgi:hypothetical protein